MELDYRRETVTEALRAEIQQSLHEDVDLERIVIVRLLVLPRPRQCVQHVEHLLGRALAPDRHHEFVRRGCAG